MEQGLRKNVVNSFIFTTVTSQFEIEKVCITIDLSVRVIKPGCNYK